MAAPALTAHMPTCWRTVAVAVSVCLSKLRSSVPGGLGM